MLTPRKWIIYVRKSSESEDKQVQSIPDQIAYFKTIAEKQNLNVIEIIQDEKSAKAPYIRPGFDRLMSLIEKGKADGILCWQLNRLARNPVDSGTVHWHLQKGKIVCIKTCERDFLPEDNALFFAVIQGMDNQYLRDLSRNVKRGLYSKAERGWYPAVPMIGYLNSNTGEKGNETIVMDEKRFPLVRKMWDMMLTGIYSTMDIYRIATEEWKLDTTKLRRKGTRMIAIGHVYKIFTSIFYTGNFYYAGKFYKGNHTPMITMQEFEKVQFLLHTKDHPRPIAHDFPFTGIMKCANCGSAITASLKRKLLKGTGETKAYTYYHCTRRIGIDDCTEPPITLAALMEQIQGMVARCGINSVFYEHALEVLVENEAEKADYSENIVIQQKDYVTGLERKIQRLMGYLVNETISEEDYRKQKKDLENQLAIENVRQGQIDSRFRRYSEELASAFHFCRAVSHALKHGATLTLREILSHFGSNQRLSQKNLCVDVFGWFLAIKKGEGEFAEQFHRFELEKANGERLKSDFFTFFPLMRAIIENVRNEFRKADEAGNKIIIPDFSEWIKKLPLESSFPTSDLIDNDNN